ncbi:type II toxin-antitoxin system VapC family toxin [Iningainema tapete]|uniref:Nucleic acid-binding protein n=1 Tax=Iningainema tapete BLCC-T55 TaxID=2748662 RepID=A0A8J6XHV7_9CYAN|nr:nucleic acid-binding protein [Iningainema tapete]MBD2774638.1 nucleic acid-binding protein [Iningainema tapete BLCC-T55]
MIVLLDSGPLGILTNPKASPLNTECRCWVLSLQSKGYRIILPEIIDYEVRRELIRVNKLAGIKRLNEFKVTLEYLPLNTAMMLQAAEFWAQARQRGIPTADPKALDGDVILAAQATLVETEGDAVVVATTNVGHLSQFVNAREWREIS